MVVQLFCPWLPTKVLGEYYPVLSVTLHFADFFCKLFYIGRNVWDEASDESQVKELPKIH